MTYLGRAESRKAMSTCARLLDSNDFTVIWQSSSRYLHHSENAFVASPNIYIREVPATLKYILCFSNSFLKSNRFCKAAVKIQSAFRGHMDRKRVLNLRLTISKHGDACEHSF